MCTRIAADDRTVLRCVGLAENAFDLLVGNSTSIKLSVVLLVGGVLKSK